MASGELNSHYYAKIHTSWAFSTRSWTALAETPRGCPPHPRYSLNCLGGSSLSAENPNKILTKDPI